ncbi:MAG: SgcJ/EcaC family oxidoreductase [Acidobacteriota bacterium]|nr:SgcJ/EcaC family oxidoreductase [Acidobacteriota bacterium]
MRNRIPATVLATLAAAVIAAAAQAGPPETASRSEVRKWIEKGNSQWVEGFKRGDPSLVAEAFAPDAVNVGKDGTADVGRDAIRERTRKYLETSGPATSARADIGDFVISGDLAYEWGTSDARFAGKPGGPAKRAGRYLTCWKKQPDGSWKIFRNNSLEAEPGKE